MLNNDTRSKLENIVKRVVIEGTADTCTAIRNLLCRSFSTSTTVKRDFESKAITKKELAEFLKSFAIANKESGLILEDIHDENVIVNSNTLFFIATVFYTAFQES